MTDDNVKTMVNSLADGDNVAAQSAFKDALTDKIGLALDDKRQTVANDWLNSAQDLEANKDASELDNLGASPEGIVGGEDSESLEIDQDEEEDEQPTV